MSMMYQNLRISTKFRVRQNKSAKNSGQVVFVDTLRPVQMKDSTDTRVLDFRVVKQNTCLLPEPRRRPVTVVNLQWSVTRVTWF